MTDNTQQSTGRLTDWKGHASYYRLRLQQRIFTWVQQARDPDRQNAMHLFGDIAWFGVANGIIGTYMSVFAIRLGASKTLIGLLSSLPALINILWQIPAGRLVQSSRNILGITIKSLFSQRVMWLLIGLMPFLLTNYRPEAVVALVTLATLPAAVGGLAFTTLFANSVTAEERGGIASIRNMLLALTSMTSVLVAGWLLNVIAFPYNYQIFFVVAFAASMASLYHVKKIEPNTKTPETVPAVEGLAAPPERPVSLKERLHRVWASLSEVKAFRDLTLGSFAYNWGMSFPAALYGLYRVNTLGASDAWLGLLSMAMSATQMVMFIVWGRVLKRSGSRWLTLLGAFGLAGFPLLTGLSPSVEPLLLVAIWGGFFNTAYSIGRFDAFMAACPANRLPTLTAFYNVLMNVTAFVAPLLGTTVANWIGLRYALILGGVLRILGALIMSRLTFGSPPTGGPGYFRRQIHFYTLLVKDRLQRRQSRRG
jgi:MFS family permease